MTQQEIIKKAEARYPLLQGDGIIDEELKYGIHCARNAYCDALTQIESFPKIHGWVARDNNGGSNLHFFTEKPYRSTAAYSEYNGDEPTFWSNVYGQRFILLSNMFPDLTWSDEPKEVELIIRAI